MEWDGIITIGIVVALIFIIYTRIKKQTLRESYDEVKELVAPEK